MELYAHIGMFKSGSTAIRNSLHENNKILKANGFHLEVDELYKASHFLLNNKKAFRSNIYNTLNQFLETHSNIYEKPTARNLNHNTKHLFTSEFLFLSSNPKSLFQDYKFREKNTFITIRNNIKVLSGLFNEILTEPGVTFTQAKKNIFSLNYNLKDLYESWSNYSDLTMIPYNKFSVEKFFQFLSINNFHGDNQGKPNSSLPLYLVEVLFKLKSIISFEDFITISQFIEKDIEKSSYTNDCPLLKNIIDFNNLNNRLDIEFFITQHTDFEEEFSLCNDIDSSKLEENNTKFRRYLRIILLKTELINKYKPSEMLNHIL